MPKKKQEALVDIDDKYIDNIKKYGDSIETLASFVEAVRKLPGMYIGAIGNMGWLSCIREIVQNAIDEMEKEASPCHYIKITFNEADQSILVEDTGRGIPHGRIIHIYTSAHSSSNYTKKPGEYSSGVHGVGSGVALSLSKTFNVKSYILGQAVEVNFTAGIPWKNGEKNIKCPEGRQGTTVFMTPDYDVLGPVALTCNDVFDMVFKIFPLIHIGDRIDFTGIDLNGKTIIYEELVNKDGIVTDLMLRTQTPLVAPIMYKADNGTMKAEIAFTFDSANIAAPEDINSFSNYTNTISGTHVTGFLNALSDFFRNYMNKIFLGEKSKIKVVGNDVKSGLKAIVVCAHLHPIFIGQSKAMITNEDLKEFVYNLTKESLDQWSKTNPNDLQKVCKYIKDIAELRMKSDDNKINLSKKYTTNLLTGKPKKYVQASGNKNLELIIVEGDSALGSAKNSRDYHTQSVFPVKGKIPNVFEKSRADVLSNQEIASIITIIGGGYGKNFDISKVKFDKIIMLADADPDGNHIRTLLLRFFLLYMPEIITSGRLYASIPPLYGIKMGKSMKYFISKIDFAKYAQSLFMKKYSFTHMNNSKMTGIESTAFFATNVDYNYYMKSIIDVFAVDPSLLEALLYGYAPYIKFTDTKKKHNTRPKSIIDQYYDSIGVGKKQAKQKKEEGDFIQFIENSPIRSSLDYELTSNFNFTKFKNTIEKQFRFVNVSKKKNGPIIISGLVNWKDQYIILDNRFIGYCKSLIDIIQSNTELYYKLNGEKSTIHDIMSAFDNSIPSGLTRFKGLGEQNPEELGESALRPDSSRTLVRYNIEDVKNEIELMRFIDSNRGIILRDISVTRQEIE